MYVLTSIQLEWRDIYGAFRNRIFIYSTIHLLSFFYVFIFACPCPCPIPYPPSPKPPSFLLRERRNSVYVCVIDWLIDWFPIRVDSIWFFFLEYASIWPWNQCDWSTNHKWNSGIFPPCLECFFIGSLSVKSIGHWFIMIYPCFASWICIASQQCSSPECSFWMRPLSMYVVYCTLLWHSARSWITSCSVTYHPIPVSPFSFSLVPLVPVPFALLTTSVIRALDLIPSTQLVTSPEYLFPTSHLHEYAISTHMSNNTPHYVTRDLEFRKLDLK